MSNVNGGTITVRVEGKDIGLSDLLTRINQQMVASGNNAKTYATQMAQISPALAADDAALAKYATSLASVAKAQGDTVGSQKLLAEALQQITPATTSANTVMLRLQQSLNQEALAAEKDAAALAKLNAVKQSTPQPPANTPDPNNEKILTLGKLVVGYQVATRVAREFADVINEGNELEKTLTTFRVLSGSAQEYEKNLQIAKSQQSQFGGSLNDTVTGMSEFANLSHRTGIEVNKLTNLARALATVDPAQGFKGASIALKEFLSGDNVTSLSRRFEIPKEALNSIQALTDKKAQFAALTAELEKFGISEELVTAQAATTAASFDKLTGAASDAKAALGTALASAFEQSAKNITVELTAVANGLTTLVSRSQQLQGFAGKIFDQTTTGGIEAFNQKIIETNAAIDGNDPIMGRLIGHLQTLTPAEYAFVAALTAQKVSATDALSALEANRAAVEAIDAALQNAIATYPESTSAITQLNGALAANASSSAEAAAFSQGLAERVAEGLPVEQAMIALQQFKANQLAITNAAIAEGTGVTQDALTATTLFTQTLTEEALAKANSQIQGDALKISQENLYNAALAAAQGMGATAESAALLAQQFGITAAAAYGLISAIQQLEVAKAKKDSGLSPKDFDSNAEFLQASKEAIATNENFEKLIKAQADNAYAAANTAGKLKLEQEALGKLKKGTAEYEVQLGKVNAAQRALTAEEERNAKKKGGAPKLTPNEKINTALLDDQDKFDAKMEDAEQKHWDKMADIYDKFNEEQQKQFAKNEVSKRRSRADFYSGLQDAPAGVDTQKFAQQYEEAFAKAQEIAQTGKAKLAEQFLELRQKQIEEMKQLDEEAAKINADQKEGKISKKDADAQLEFLAGRKKLIEDAQKEEQDQLLAGGDENQNKLQEQLTAEQKAYADNTDAIIEQSQRAADAKVAHAQRNKIAVSEENKVLADQEGYYTRIARLNGGKIPDSAKTAKPSTTVPASDADKPVSVEATTPIPVTTTEALIVQQAELFLVHDAEVLATIADVGARLESKLGEVVLAVNSAKDTISGAVNAVKEAVGKIKPASTSVVGA